MSISFPALIIYLLPGFLGLWVFKRSIQEDLDKRSESTQIAIALLLGISAIGMLFAVHYVLSFCGGIADYVSPQALSLKVTENDEVRLILDGSMKFWIAYFMLCVLALFSGALWAFVREKGFSVTNFFSDCVNKTLKRGVQRPCESAMRSLIDEMREHGHEPSLIRIYSLGENRDKALMGWWDGHSDSEKEIKLSLLECCEAASDDLVKNFDLQNRRCVVNYDSGIVVEFLDMNEQQAEGFQEYIKSEYLKAINP